MIQWQGVMIVTNRITTDTEPINKCYQTKQQTNPIINNKNVSK